MYLFLAKTSIFQTLRILLRRNKISNQNCHRDVPCLRYLLSKIHRNSNNLEFFFTELLRKQGIKSYTATLTQLVQCRPQFQGYSWCEWPVWNMFVYRLCFCGPFRVCRSYLRGRCRARCNGLFGTMHKHILELYFLRQKWESRYIFKSIMC